MPLNEPRNKFLKRLHQLHRGTLVRVTWFGLARLVGVGGSMLMLTAWLLGNAVQPEKFVTWGLLVSLMAGLASLAWNNLLGRLWRLRRMRQLVELLERRGFFANVLIASEEALRDPDRWSDHNPVSVELRKRLHIRGAKLLENIRPADAVPINRPGQTWLAVAACLLLTVSLITAPGDTLQTGWERLWQPWTIWQDPPTGGLYAVKGPDFVVVGRDFTVAALDATGDPNTAQCEIRIGSGLWQPVPVRREIMAVEPLGQTPPFRKWVASLESIQEDFQWRFRRGVMVTEARPVEVRRHPLITELNGFVQPPDYTRLALRNMSRLPTWLEVPAGSLLGLSGVTNHPLKKLFMVTAAGDSTELEFANQNFSGEFPVQESLKFHLVLEDSFGLGNQDPLLYEIVAKPDEDPLARLERVADDGILPVHGLVDLIAEGSDDYGLTRLSLGLRVLGESGAASDLGRAEPEFETMALWSTGSVNNGGGDDWLDWSTSRGEVQLKPRLLPGIDVQGAEPIQTGVTIEARFDHLDLIPGDILELRVEVSDNRHPGPRGVGLSPVLRLTLPSAAEILTAQADSSQQRRSELEQMRKRGRQLGADLDRLSRELLKNPIPDWARQKEMEAAIERQKKMQEELAKVAAQLQQDVEKLASGQMTSEKMQERAEEVTQLLDQSQSDELNEMMRKMGNPEAQMPPKDLAEAMKEVARNQKEMARKLDAALAMLQRMDQEQEMEGIASLLEKMIRKQQELADLSRELAEEKKQNGDSETSDSESEKSESEKSESEKSESDNADSDESESGESESESSESGEKKEGPEPPDAQELARRQESLAEEMDQLQEKLEEALANLEEQNAEKSDSGSEEMQKALEQALEQMENQKSKESMDQASEELAKMDPETAAKMQQQALRDMGSLYHVILKSQSAMQVAMDQKQVTSLRQLAADMLALSARQEEIANRIPPRIRDVRSLEMTRGQHRIQKAAVGVRDRLTELMSESPNRILRLLEKLDVVIETMGQSLNALEENRAQAARSGATSSLALSNRIVIGLLTEAQMSSSSSGGGSGQQQQKSLSEQLKEMAKDQAELNALTEQMRQMLANRGISQQARAQMKRLGEGQGELAGRMRDLAEEARQNPEGDRVLGDLGELGETMETLSQEVEQGLVSEETLIRQERILSRMLDARNSVRQRDYTSRRESHTAEQLYDPLGGMMDDPTLPGQQDPFELRYQPLEKAPLEYRNLVRKYFQALEKFRESERRDRELP
jgi:hypothetical protein